MKESDWKTFRKSLPEVRERYLNKLNEELAQMLKASDLSATERFWKTHEQINEEAKILQECLDGASRSRMETMIFSMLGCGMMRLEDLENYSQELRDRARAWFENPGL
jgi:uncharacterized protein YpbB